jgi:NAD(P)-dependent dehydrogenase (short-subunit alcohol dehydrogenase family)
MDPIAVVTGATNGIGKITARELAKKGYRVVLVARNAEKAARTATEIAAAAPGALVETILCDMSSQKQIRAAAAELKHRHDRLHVLVNNAGGIWMKREVTEDGLERTFAVDHLGYFLFTTLLLPQLRQGAPSRVVNVASEASKVGKIDFDDLQGEKRYSPGRAYAQAKLANILFSSELSRRLLGSGVTSNALHPGAIASGFGHNDPGIFRFVVTIARPFLIGEEKGARTSIYLASSPDVDGVSGGYFVKCQPRLPPRRARDPETARRLWEVSERMCGMA